MRSIQVLRGLAATMVVVCHCTQTVIAGAAGVDVFFVISGFIIYRVSRGRSAVRFIKDRAVRVLPMWWIMAVPWIGIAAKTHVLTPQMLATTVTLWPIYSVAAGPALQPGWSLSFEELFYVATAIGLTIPRFKADLVLAWAAFFAASFLVVGAPLVRFLGNPMILEFLAGIVIARSAYRNRLLGVSASAFAVIVFGWFAFHSTGDLDDQITAMNTANPWAASLNGGAGAAWRPFLWGVPAVALVWGALQFEDMFGGAWAKPLVYLGDASYSIYLTNFLARLFLHFFLPPWLQIVPCILCGVVVYHFVERPMLAYLRRPKAAPEASIA